MRTYSLLAILLVGIIGGCTEESQIQSSGSLYPESKGEVIDHEYFRLDYSEKHEQPFWAAYYLSADKASGDVQRTGDYREDPAVSTGSSTNQDHEGDGYDRGHLVPAEDMAFSEESMSRSFYLSNMSPMKAAFNRYDWVAIESNLREFARVRGKIFIVTGPVFSEHPKKVGENNVSIPTSFYKIAYDPEEETAIAYLVPHKNVDHPYSQFIFSVDNIENETGIDFFYKMEDSLERKIESEKGIPGNWGV